MPKFIDFHPGYQISPERIAELRQQTVEGTSDQYGVSQVELFYSPDGKGIFSLLEGADAVAVRNHHSGKFNEVMQVESLLYQ